MALAMRKFGVELEFNACEGYEDFRGTNSFFDKYDGSVGEYGREFTAPPLEGEDGLAEIDELLAYANRNGWEADNRCGLHVHVDVSNENAKELQAIACAFYLLQDVLYGLVDSSRVGNFYCRSTSEDMANYLLLNNIDDWSYFAGNINRYRWVNWNAYAKHSTVEVRLHQGTCDASAVRAWVEVCVNIADWAARVGIAKVKQALWIKDNAERKAYLAKLVSEETAAYYGF